MTVGEGAYTGAGSGRHQGRAARQAGGRPAGADPRAARSRGGQQLAELNRGNTDHRDPDLPQRPVRGRRVLACASAPDAHRAVGRRGQPRRTARRSGSCRPAGTFLAAIQLGSPSSASWRRRSPAPASWAVVAGAIRPSGQQRRADRPAASSLRSCLCSRSSSVSCCPRRWPARLCGAYGVPLRRPIEVLGRILAPLVWVLTTVTNAITRLFGITRSQRERITTEELMILVERGARAGRHRGRRGADDRRRARAGRAARARGDGAAHRHRGARR